MNINLLSMCDIQRYSTATFMWTPSIIWWNQLFGTNSVANEYSVNSFLMLNCVELCKETSSSSALQRTDNELENTLLAQFDSQSISPTTTKYSRNVTRAECWRIHFPFSSTVYVCYTEVTCCHKCHCHMIACRNLTTITIIIIISHSGILMSHDTWLESQMEIFHIFYFSFVLSSSSWKWEKMCCNLRTKWKMCRVN